MEKIPVKDETGKIVALVDRNANLDVWDGNNFTSGEIGKHLGITYLRSAMKYVLIHSTQWQGEKDWAEIISDDRAASEIAYRVPELFEDPRFRKLRYMIASEEDLPCEIIFDTAVVLHGNSQGINIPVTEAIKIGLKPGDKVTTSIVKRN